MSDDIVRHVVVQGRVQGVGYRAFVEDEAMRRQLRGWVRNRRDGSVEAVFAGPRPVVEAMIEACRRGQWLHASVRLISGKGRGPIFRKQRGAVRLKSCPQFELSSARTAARIPGAETRRDRQRNRNAEIGRLVTP